MCLVGFAREQICGDRWGWEYALLLARMLPSWVLPAPLSVIIINKISSSTPTKATDQVVDAQRQCRSCWSLVLLSIFAQALPWPALTGTVHCSLVTEMSRVGFALWAHPVE